MSPFSPEWEIQYSTGNQMSVWPWSDVVSLVTRFRHLLTRPVNILELGVGAGANVPFLVDFACKWGGNYYGVDGSTTAIEMLETRFPHCSLEVSDFTKSIPWDMNFSIILDRSSVTHNTTSAIKNAIRLIRNHLQTGGLFFGIDWFSMKHSGYRCGNIVEDEFSNRSETQGYFKGLGVTHFSDESHLKELWCEGFEFIHLEEKITTRLIPGSEDNVIGAYNFIVKKTD